MKKDNNLRRFISRIIYRFMRSRSLYSRFILLLGILSIIALTSAVIPAYTKSDSHLIQRESVIAQIAFKDEIFQSADDNPDESQGQPDDAYYSSLFAYPWQIPEEEASTSSFWIEVNLSQQMLYAYRGGQIINTFLVSTGAGQTPTVTGTYRIYAKYSAYNMTGPTYEYPDVPYTMFFYKGYSIHGTYWHNSFGTPMSWGCVNMKTEDAAWIYENAPVGTYVFIHY